MMAVMVSGVHADASFERLAFEGAPGTWNGYSNLFSIIYSGQLLRAGGSDSLTAQPLSGSLVVSHWQAPVQVANAERVRAVITHNRIDDAEISLFAFEVSDADIEITHNEVTRARFVGGGGAVSPSNSIPFPRSSRLLVAHNRFDVIASGRIGPADGVKIWDFTGAATLHAEVFDNEISAGSDTGGIQNLGANGATVRENRITGGGIVLNGASDANVVKNDIKGSATFGIALVAGSSGNTIKKNRIDQSGTFDLLWDGSGVGNAWSANHCRTSDPAGLCQLIALRH